mmetsp:Transcript_14531/g.26140  ORF Transcript_14531/g.26140 Transcript_14531/m.26140 type:complete len:205 (+) Transcript_14531:2393-3007(+)
MISQFKLKFVCESINKSYSKRTKRFLTRNEICVPISNISPFYFQDHSTSNSEICENVTTLVVNCSDTKCYSYLNNVDNMITWNPFIYQILKNFNNKSYLIHSYIKFPTIPVLEIFTPFKIIYKTRNQFLEFQNEDYLGMPICGRIYIRPSHIYRLVTLTFYVRYPMPKQLQDFNVYPEEFSLMIDEILNYNLKILKSKLEGIPL